MEIIQGRQTVAEAGRAVDLPPSEIESWIADGKRGLENALRVTPGEVRPPLRAPANDTPPVSAATESGDVGLRWRAAVSAVGLPPRVLLDRS